jgi:hypothetical protein
MNIVSFFMMYLDHVLLLAKRLAPFPFSPLSNTASIYSHDKLKVKSRTIEFEIGYPALCLMNMFSSPVDITSSAELAFTSRLERTISTRFSST